MKQLLFLLLFPCLAVAQYSGNGNQKITLGEQTTADGLVYRGVLNDTALITPSSDTSAYIILDTVNNRFYNYNRSTNVWSLAGGGVSVTSFSAGTTGLSPSTATTGAVTLGGTLSVANGGTNTSTLTANKVMVGNGTSGVLTPTELHWNNSLKRLGIGTSSPTWQLDVVGLNQQILNLESYSSTFSDYQGEPGVFLTKSASNTVGTKSTTRDGENLGSIFFNGVRIDGSVRTAAFMRVVQVGSAGTVNIPAQYSFYTSNGVSSATERLTISPTGNIGIGQTTPTARLHLAQGTATASTAPLKFTSGTNLTTAEAGAMEFNGTNLFFSPSTTRHTINHGLTGSATLDFPSTTTLLSADLTISVTGAADGDVVSLGVPNAAVNANTCYTAWVSAANTVTVRFNNYSSGTVNPASGIFKVFVTK